MASNEALGKYEQKILGNWEEVYKKGQLTFWVLLALKDGPKHMSGIKDFIAERTNKTITADDQSMYRALRRYYSAELVDYTAESSKGGPDRKVYHLTNVGQRVLAAFCARNLTPVFYQGDVRTLITKEG